MGATEDPYPVETTVAGLTMFSAYELSSLFGRYVRRLESPRPFGKDGRIRVNCFLDLLSAAHDTAFLDGLARRFAGWIAARTNADRYSGVACPKRGNVLLSREVARILGKKSGFVKYDVMCGSWLEGKLASGDRVLLVDDVASDGEMLVDAADALRADGVFVDEVFVLVNRAEGDAVRLLTERGISLSACVCLSDEELMRL